MAVDNHIFLKIGSDLFSREPLERGDHVEAVREIGFSAQAIFGCPSPPTADVPVKIDQADLPGGHQLVSRNRAKDLRCRPGESLVDRPCRNSIPRVALVS
jgi:hypothetical protein